MKTTLKILKISGLICLLLILLNYLFGGLSSASLGDPKMYGTFLFYSLVLTFINAIYFGYFSDKIGWENAGLRRVLFAASGSIVLTLMGFFICRFIDYTLFRGYDAWVFLRNERAENYLFPLLFTAVVSLFFHLLYFYRALQEKKVTEQKIIAGTASAKFESLKNQLDPHFLFNSLNVLSSLIDENPDQAQKFTSSLSKVYRYVLEQKDKELVELEEELAFAATYMNLLKMRFENSIFYELPKDLMLENAKVVPLSLQLLLENAVKHNVISENRPLKIRIFEDENELVVENNLQKKEVLNRRKGVGLQNIIDRYQLVTRRKVSIEQNTEVFRVRLPLLTKQLTAMKNVEPTKENAYLRAQQRVKEIKGFYGNLITYCLVIPILAFINYKTYWGFQWFWFPLLGWGMGLAMHGFSVFKYGRDWEEKKIREIMEKEQQHSKTWN